MQPPEEPPTQPDNIIRPGRLDSVTAPGTTMEPVKHHHWYRPRNVMIGAGAFIVGIVAISLAAGGGSDKGSFPPSPPPHNYNTPAATVTSPSPAPVPSPDGKYTGSCDYTIGDDPVDGTARAVGEVDLDNTGNIGTVVKVKITWPQEGYDPITAYRTVHVPVGASGQAVSFHMPLSYDQITRLQSWQTNHDFKDGCTYNASITGTYGKAH